MKVLTVFIVAGGLFLASCSPNGQSDSNSDNSAKVPATATKASEVAPNNPGTAKKAEPGSPSPTAQPSSVPMKDHELLAYFQPSDADMYATCTDEKGPSDDFYNGKPIPMDLVEKYDLFQFNMSPPLRLKYRLPNPQVSVMGNVALKYQDYRMLIYSVGIGMESEDEPVDEGVDTRVLVLTADGEIFANYFVAGYVRRQGREEESVCRKMTFKGKEIVLTIIEEATTNIPSHLRLEDVETRDL